VIANVNVRPAADPLLPAHVQRHVSLTSGTARRRGCVEDRVPDLKHAQGLGYCNITKCCTKVCPEHITITDNAIIPLKERVVDRFYDPVTKLLRVITGKT
jgi:succinate dehydrogenase/fumarate reductase-like Fe-S protein